MSLKQAVQEQLDLILKLEEERKLMKKQNRTLKEKINQLVQLNKNLTQNSHTKIEKQYTDQQTNTNYEQNNPQRNLQLVQKSGCDILKLQLTDINFTQPKQTNEVACQYKEDKNETILDGNISKLQQAQQVLKMLQFDARNDSRVNLTMNNCSRVTQQQSRISAQKSPTNAVKATKTSGNQINVESLSAQILKISKQIVSLKKELQNSENLRKNKEKELKDTKKCLQNKAQAYEKLRKQFNQLSTILNTDKYKSIRTLQKQFQMSKKQLLSTTTKLQQVKQILKGLTQQYDLFRKKSDLETQKLQNELIDKNKQLELISQQNKKYKLLFTQYQRTQKYLTHSLQESHQ